jgi:riboflavin synthase
MFTGIIKEIGIIAATPAGKLVIKAMQALEGLQLGGSVAVNGACQTVVEFNDSTFTVEVMPETLRRTNLGKLRIGDRVNLERPLGLGGEIGGHLVQGRCCID